MTANSLIGRSAPRNRKDIARQFPELKALVESADHVDVKVVTSKKNLREFIAGMMNYFPSWVKALYGVRSVFVRFLGMRQENMRMPKFTADSIPMETGKSAAFFKVKDASENRRWVVDITEKHLTAALGVVVEAQPNGMNTFYVLTIVHYHHWTGPVYFNVIRPFHHVVVSRMAKAGASA
jgi:hypothetical protein